MLSPQASPSLLPWLSWASQVPSSKNNHIHKSDFYRCWGFVSLWQYLKRKQGLKTQLLPLVWVWPLPSGAQISVEGLREEWGHNKKHRNASCIGHDPGGATYISDPGRPSLGLWRRRGERISESRLVLNKLLPPGGRAVVWLWFQMTADVLHLPLRLSPRPVTTHTRRHTRKNGVKDIISVFVVGQLILKPRQKRLASYVSYKWASTGEHELLAAACAATK